jgi:hypothetical protein
MDNHRSKINIKALITIAIAFVLIVALILMTYMKNQRLPKTVIHYQYQTSATAYEILEMKKYQKYENIIEPYILSDANSEGSPYWGIKILLGENGDYLFLYTSHSKEINITDEGEPVDSIIIQDKEMKLFESVDMVYGQYKLPDTDYHGFHLVIHKDIFQELKYDIVEMIKTGKVITIY